MGSLKFTISSHHPKMAMKLIAVLALALLSRSVEGNHIECKKWATTTPAPATTSGPFTNPACNPATWVKFSWKCCTKDTPCGIGEGDCDNDAECAGDLECGKNNCPEEFNAKVGRNKPDCCFDNRPTEDQPHVPDERECLEWEEIVDPTTTTVAPTTATTTPTTTTEEYPPFHVQENPNYCQWEPEDLNGGYTLNGGGHTIVECEESCVARGDDCQMFTYFAETGYCHQFKTCKNPEKITKDGAVMYTKRPIEIGACSCYRAIDGNYLNWERCGDGYSPDTWWSLFKHCWCRCCSKGEEGGVCG